MSGPTDARPAQDRFRSLSDDVALSVWTEHLHTALHEFYLADPDDPYQQSGRSTGVAGWEPKRRLIADAFHRDGDVLDVGCANGLLLESLIGWCAEKGVSIRPHGVDFVWELVALARARHPDPRSTFEVANVLWWHPPRRYDFVRTNLEYFRAAERETYVRRLVEGALVPGGRLVLCHYAEPSERRMDADAWLAAHGYTVVGSAAFDTVSVAWADVPA